MHMRMHDEGTQGDEVAQARATELIPASEDREAEGEPSTANRTDVSLFHSAGNIAAPPTSPTESFRPHLDAIQAQFLRLAHLLSTFKPLSGFLVHAFTVQCEKLAQRYLAPPTTLTST